MDVSLDKADLITLVLGLNPPMELEGKYTQFCGNQWNDDWKWNREKLNSMTEQELYTLYLVVRDSNNEKLNRWEEIRESLMNPECDEEFARMLEVKFKHTGE